MKNIKFILIGLSTVISGCGFIDEDVNIDPNNPIDASVNLLLPSTQVNYGFVLGGDFGRPVSIWLQQSGGAERQHTGYDVYQLREADVNNAWSTIYASSLDDLELIINKSDESGSPHYAGVAKVMKAIIAMNLVDLFNDIPWSEALDGSGNLNPAFESAASIYDEAIRLLEEAKVDLTAESSLFSPLEDDLIYGGDLASWTVLANTIIARNRLNRAELDGNYNSVLEAIGDSVISSNAENALIPFANNNPWFAFETDRGDVAVGAYIVDLMNGLNDPRRAEYFTIGADSATSTYIGMRAGVPDNGSTIARFGSAWASPDSPIPLATVWEVKFMEAEAALRTDDIDRAVVAYNEGIEQSLTYYGIEDQDYIDAQGRDSNDLTLEDILTQKYIALYTQQQPFNDWRRTGLPVIEPAAGQNRIATRFPYPSDERLYNAESYEPYVGVTVFDKVFWDQD